MNNRERVFVTGQSEHIIIKCVVSNKEFACIEYSAVENKLNKEL
jgi:hypothetical protein